ncbi:LOG family protein [Rubritalea tangerina]|uniref:LOG family protein n=1 Tax=Rubritalea tangerina TaxID=430798 RepID=A0ABW4ZFY7_9BACT
MKCAIVRELDSLEAFLRQKGQLHCAVVQGLDFTDADINWQRLDFQGAVFLGCHFPKEVTADFLVEKGAVVFPQFPELPYNPYRNRLYARAELMEGWSAQEDRSVDKIIYDHFVKKGKSKADILESLAQRLHDHAIDDGVRDLLGGRIEEGGQKKVVGIMGGHGTSRDDPYFKKVVQLARLLAQQGYFVATGGGPGTMEAANLGAWLVDASDQEVERVIEVLKAAPHFESPGYMEAAQKVLDLHPEGGTSLAVPTWFYGHEPSNLFSRHIAKYFSNSIREDGLLAIATYGVVFAPGSAGTTQEIFMDATQNHYGTFDDISPMVFLGEKRYMEDTLLFPCLSQLADGRQYSEYIYCTDEIDSAVKFIEAHPPVKYVK